MNRPYNYEDVLNTLLEFGPEDGEMLWLAETGRIRDLPQLAREFEDQIAECAQQFNIEWSYELNDAMLWVMKHSGRPCMPWVRQVA